MKVSDTRTIVFATPHEPMSPTSSHGMTNIGRPRAFRACVEIARGSYGNCPRILLKFDTVQTPMPRDFNVQMEELKDLRTILDEAIEELKHGT